MPRDPERSILLAAVRGNDPNRKAMPPGGKLKAEEISALEDWIRAGAAMPEGKPRPKSTKEYEITEEQRAFWSFQPVAKPKPPAVKQTQRVRGDIDRFVIAKLEGEGLQLAKPADRRTLLRRATMDITGLPPTMEEVENFLADKSANAWEKVVDRLLASTAYGERWGRYWLDVARYADDKLNSTEEEPYPNSFRYRNWVIGAFNRDLPFNQFVKAQIAGDLMESKDPNEFAAATGFLALSPEMQDERVDALTRGFLGLTVACAQCHDHKFDPIPTKDFYSFQGILNGTELHETPLVGKEQVEAWTAQKRELDTVEKRVKDFYDNQSRMIGEVLAARTARYLMAAVGKGEAKQLDEETLGRWKKYLANDRLYHPYLDEFRKLEKGNAPTEQLEAAAQRFEKLVLAIHEEKKTVDLHNQIKLGADPSRNDLSQTELEAMSRDKTVLWRDLFERSIGDAGGSIRYQTGLFYYGKGSIERFLAGPWKEYLDEQQKLVAAMKKALPERYPFLQTIADKAKPGDMRVWIRGDRNNPGDIAPRRFLAILSRGEAKPFTKGAGRLELAEAIASDNNPLTPRVIANRVWQMHFGRGIVSTPSNFGQLGERPTHPELLDYLANYLVTNGWSLKKLHKLILMSGTYALSAETVEANLAKDPDNRLLWRANRRRLDAEALRDSLLAASGELDRAPAQQAIPLDREGNRKRTVYGFISRRKVDGTLALFDFPNPQATSEARMATNVPLQRLFLMNSPFVEQRATALAGQLRGTDAEKIRAAYRLLFQREPDARELALGLDYVKSGSWAQYARVLLGSNEFLFVN